VFGKNNQNKIDKKEAALIFMMNPKSDGHIRTVYRLLLAVILAAQFSCGIFRESPEVELERNRKLWRESKITNYRMTVDLRKSGHAGPRGTFIFTVRRGAAESVAAAKPELTDSSEDVEQYDTIEKLFQIIESAAKRRPGILEIEYEPQLGYPRKLDLDYKSFVSDDELYFQILQIENLE